MKILKYFINFVKILKKYGLNYTIKKIITFFKKKLDNKLSNCLYISRKEKIFQKNKIFNKKIKISIITPLFNTPKKYLKEMINSVLAQTYNNWELCLVDGSDDKYSYLENICKKYSKKDNRIKYKKLIKNEGISENSNRAIEISTGDYIGLLDHDDILHPSALFYIMQEICNKDADFIFTDEATFNNNNKYIVSKHFKPDYAIDTLRSNNYICHFLIFSRKIMEVAGVFRSEYDGSQDHNLVLRYTSIASKIIHISKLLYFWRSHDSSVASNINTKKYAIEAGINAVNDNISKHGINAKVESTVIYPTLYRIYYEIINNPYISIIIYTKDNIINLKRCIKSIINKTTYKNYEIIIVDNNSTDENILNYYLSLKNYENIRIIFSENKVLTYSEGYNFGVKFSKGEQLIFLSNNIELISHNWIEEMLMYSQREDIGIVGIKIYNTNNTIKHAGIVTEFNNIAFYTYNGQNKNTIGYMGNLHYTQNKSAVTSACMMIKKKTFIDINQFDINIKYIFNDIDLCFKTRKAGYLIVWTPFAEAYYYVSESIESDTQKLELFYKQDTAFLKEKWKNELESGDPYYNSNFSFINPGYSYK